MWNILPMTMSCSHLQTCLFYVTTYLLIVHIKVVGAASMSVDFFFITC